MDPADELNEKRAETRKDVKRKWGAYLDRTLITPTHVAPQKEPWWSTTRPLGLPIWTMRGAIGFEWQVWRVYGMFAFRRYRHSSYIRWAGKDMYP